MSLFNDNNKQEIIRLLEIIKNLVATSEDSTCGDKEKAIQEIDLTIKLPSKEKIAWLLTPTGNLQELSIDNGWADDFITLANSLENLNG